MVFRSNHPQKTGTKGQYPKYSQYKRVLMNDFYNCCGYCNDSIVTMRKVMTGLPMIQQVQLAIMVEEVILTQERKPIQTYS